MPPLSLGLGVGLSSAAPPAEVKDPHFANVVSLLHFNGNLTDVTGKIWTASGNAAATGAAKFGSNSLACDGAGDSITTPLTGDFSFGFGELTMEAWIKLSSCNVYAPIFDSRYEGFGGYWMATFGVADDSGTLRPRFLGQGFDLIPSNLEVQLNTWHHIAATSISGAVFLFLDGVRSSTFGTLGSNPFNCVDTPRIGRTSDSMYFFDGLIDEFRVTKGVARYTANFTPPTAPFPNS